ncbi:MAG: urease accessory protein UreF [Burkholderiales bacterium]
MNPLALARLLRLASPALPVGAFSYSQGLEWAIEAGTVSDENSAAHWIGSLLRGNLARFELPMLVALMEAWRHDDLERAQRLNAEYIATRETAELRAETLQTGSALRAALAAGEGGDTPPLGEFETLAFPTAFAFAAAGWEIPAREAAVACAFSWLENQVTAAIKLVPLGQSAGQRMLAALSRDVVEAVETALHLDGEEWSNFAPLYAVASCKHETQYTRLFRS